MPEDFTAPYTPRIYTRLATSQVQLDLGATADDVREIRNTVAGQPAAIQALADKADQLLLSTAPIGEIRMATLVDLPAGLRLARDAVSTGVQDVLTQVGASQLALAQGVAAGAKQVLDALAQGNTDTQHRIDGMQSDLTTEIRQSTIAAADDVVRRLGGLLSLPTWSVGPRALPLVRLLVQVQTLALDRTPGEIYTGPTKRFIGGYKENAALDGLRNAAANEAAVLGPPEGGLAQRFQHAFDPFEGVDPADRSKRFVELSNLIRAIGSVVVDDVA